MGRSCFLWIVNKSRKGRPIWAGLLIGLLGGLLLSGCSRPQTNRAPGGKAAVTENSRGAEKPVEGNAATITRGKGKLVVKRGITEKEMGMPFYPGAKVEQSLSASRDTDEKPGAMKQALLTTPDAVAKVKAFYLKAYPKARAMDMNSPEAAMVQLIVQDANEQKYIMIARKAKEDRTGIMMRYTTEK